MVPLGQIVITQSALGALSSEVVNASIARHQIGDWGDVEQEDREANDQSLKDGDRLLSVYHDGKTKFWIISEAVDESGNRAATTVLLPSDY